MDNPNDPGRSPCHHSEEISVASNVLRLRGRFSHLSGVHLGPSALYCGEPQWPGDLVQCDRESRRAVFTAPLWVQRDRISVGSVVPWLPDGWQYFHVNMILAPPSTWQRRSFVPSDAQALLGELDREWYRNTEDLEALLAQYLRSRGVD